MTEIIERPSAVVAAYMTDPARAPEWYANIAAVAWKAPLPLQVGTEGAFVARFLGRELRYTYEVIEDTPVSLVMRTAQGPFPMETSYRYEPLPDGSTAVTLRNRGAP
ncbi:SRPBCC family protein [Aeromicrobium sp.]|uniref:SRPBCC family protein n=1 Tax=Aeromicrobium sp. TaxID=1871063 RepID=UPI0025C13950|nr:SRPBCC family protein [Aeromicrobium sp.]